MDEGDTHAAQRATGTSKTINRSGEKTHETGHHHCSAMLLYRPGRMRDHTVRTDGTGISWQ